PCPPLTSNPPEGVCLPFRRRYQSEGSHRPRTEGEKPGNCSAQQAVWAHAVSSCAIQDRFQASPRQASRRGNLLLALRHLRPAHPPIDPFGELRFRPAAQVAIPNHAAVTPTDN